MIIHIMKDGTRRDSIEGVVVPLETHKNLYHIIDSISKEVNRGECTRQDPGE